MFGFRRKLCALVRIIGIGIELDNQYSLNKNTPVVFWYIKNAYDDASLFVMVWRLKELGSTERAHPFIRDFGYNRNIGVRLGRVLSETRIIGK